MALSKEDLDELDLAIASGELTVKVDGREVTYRSIDDLMKARRHVAGVLRTQAGARSNPLAGIRPRISRGL
ncbi:MAG: hypothetical protein LPH21_14825 [Shewanella sp.]|nr:hypothetical protein [Shewanella sp.]